MNVNSLLNTLRKKNLAAATVRRSLRKRPTLRVESLEDRAVPSTLPAPVVDQTSFRSIGNDEWAPVTATDPSNPNQIFMAYVTHGGNGTRIGVRYSTNGGRSWSAAQNFTDPVFGGINPWLGTSVDPIELPAVTPFEQVSDPAVSFDRFGNVFLTYTEYHSPRSAGQVT